VYSGFAPISVRLVQCIAQKGGVLSNPTAEKDKGAKDDADKSAKGTGTKVQAHPIVGWKGFDDVLASIPGETVDVSQKSSGTESSASTMAALGEWLCFYVKSEILKRFLPVRPHNRTTTTVVFFLGGCTYTEIAALRWVGRQNRGTWRNHNFHHSFADHFTGRTFLVATTGMISGASIIEGIAGVGRSSLGPKETGI
jgi:hypothetical protein